MSTGKSGAGALADALLVTLATPTTWPLALAAFLLRGGILVVALPIIVLPTPVGVGNAVGPALTSIAFGSVPTELVVVIGSIVVGVLIWLVAGGWLAAGLEAEGARIVGRDEDVVALRGPEATPGGRPADRHLAGRILAARLLASLPLGVVLATGSVRLVFVTYRELASPLDVATPILVRVLRGSLEVVIAIVVAWMVAEIVGALAARRITLARSGVGGALRHAVATCVRHPVSTLVRFCVPTLVLFLVLVPSALAAAAAFDAIGATLGGRSDPIGILVGVIVFVTLWAVGLLLASVVCAWRAAIWTVGGDAGGDVRGVLGPPTGSLAH